MRMFWKAAIAAMALGRQRSRGGAGTGGQQYGQQYNLGIGPDGGVCFSYDSGGYCDQWGCPDDFWDLPVYYGSVFYDDQWFDGPVYYRDWYGRRQYWIHGDWRFDEWRGPHPGWWREGRYGPPLGMEFYRSHGFHGRWDNDRGYDQRRNFAPNDRSYNHGPISARKAAAIITTDVTIAGLIGATALTARTSRKTDLKEDKAATAHRRMPRRSRTIRRGAASIRARADRSIGVVHPPLRRRRQASRRHKAVITTTMVTITTITKRETAES